MAPCVPIMRSILYRILIANGLVFSLFLNSVFAQKSTIKGIIRDVATKEGLLAASVLIEGTTTGAQTDFEGKFKLDVPANKPHRLVFRSLGYTTKTLELTPLPEGSVKELNLDLSEEVKENKEVVITVKRRADTDVSLITDMRKAEMVVNGITAEQIVRSPDRDAAQVMARVPGVTVIENRFVMIRGVSERYNSVMINDVISPGTEVDTRAFSFDLIASNMIERMMVFKSGSATLPGEFAGGVVKIYTKNSFAENFTNVTIGSALRTATSFNQAWKPEGSSTDFLGFDNGFRQLPSTFPKSLSFQNMPVSEQVNLARSLNSNFSNSSFNNLPDIRFGVNLGRRWKTESYELSTVNSLNYSKTNQNLQVKRFRYGYWNEGRQKSDTLFSYTDDSYTQNVRISAISNWNLKVGRSQYEVKNMFNQIGDNESTIRNGQNAERSNDLLRNYSYHYTARSLYGSQVSGSHELSGKSNLTWVAGYSYTNRNEPDYRRVRTYRNTNSENPYELIVAASSGALFETGRFYSNLTEHVGTAGANYTLEFKNPLDSSRATFRTGVYTESKSRDFQARYFVYLLKNNSQNQDLLTLPLGDIFSNPNVAPDKFVLEEGTRPEDGYQAQNLLAAGYAELALPLGKWKFVGGIRPEWNQQSLQSSTAIGKVRVNNPILSPLGFFNASYDLSKRWVGRLAYSKTVNRPEFRELAPFVYYDFNLDLNFVGNPNLKVANIHNLDVRFEFYPTRLEIISLGAFYKRFDNPIETKVSPVGLSPQFTYSNANSANNYGIELEVRKSLGISGGGRFIDRLYAVSNASLIHSQVDLGVVGSQERIRALQGQSPYVVNGGLYYSHEPTGLNLTALYNVFGKRIFMVGDNLFPSIYEMPRHVVDLTVSKQLGKTYNLRASVSDLLNYQSQLIQDSNRDGKITGTDETIASYRRGTYFSFTVAAQF